MSYDREEDIKHQAREDARGAYPAGGGWGSSAAHERGFSGVDSFLYQGEYNQKRQEEEEED